MTDEQGNGGADEATPPSEEPAAANENEDAAPGAEDAAPGAEGAAPESAGEPAAEADTPEEPGTPEEPAAEEPAAAPAKAEEPAAAAEPESATERPKAKDQPPGAELEPIAIEPERELGAEERARLEAEAEERARLEAEAEAGDEPVARSGPQVVVPAEASIQATGKRKSSIARVVLRAGEGGFEVNGRPLDQYFPRQNLRSVARQPLLTAGYESTVDVSVRVHGGGISGQAGAVRHGVARALCEIDPELRPELKRRGLLTRDARKKERRKAGLKKARKRPQFSKR
jgi:small subunit ribosomal protein S9